MMSLSSLSTIPSVRVVEVGPRDGLQSEQNTLSTDVKAELIRRLVADGVREIELTSFVRPDRIPQLADAEELLARLQLEDHIRTIVLAPNTRALQRAQRAGASEIAVFAAASETFSERNIGCSITDSIAMVSAVAADALADGIAVRGYVSTIFGCPFEGDVSRDAVASVVDAMLTMGCGEVSLGDSTGIGTFGEVQELIGFLGKRFGTDRLAAHMHDTYGQGLANSLAAIEAGVRVVDTSIGGLGGCPFAGGRARGNLATEDLAYALSRSGLDTGLDVMALVRTAWWVSEQLGRPPASRVATACASDAKVSEAMISEAMMSEAMMSEAMLSEECA